MTYATTARLIRDDIKAGYGVENIAVDRNLALADVQKEVRRLRARGDLNRMFPRKIA